MTSSSQQPAQGILFIGDPHLWSSNPGRRRDASFRKVVLGKLAQAAEISNRRNLIPVCLGDLFHKPGENDIETLVGLARVLAMFDRKLITLDGNHDKKDLKLSDSNPMTLLKITSAIEVIDEPGVCGEFDLVHPDGRKHRIILGGTSYGHPLPTSFQMATGRPRPPEVDTVIWLTHEDLAFEGGYPGALPMGGAKDIDMVVNGHIHGTKIPVLADGTAYYNPGNITRMSIDMAEHIPAVWEWTPFDNKGMASSTGRRVPNLERHVLKHAPAAEAFNFEGRHTAGATLIKEIDNSEDSLFVRIMRSEAENHRMDDAAYARETLMEVLDEQQVAQEVRLICNHLCDQALEQHQGGK